MDKILGKYRLWWAVAILLFSGTALAAGLTLVPDIIVTGTGGIWTDTRAYSDFASAISTIGANSRNVYIFRAENITSNVSVNSTTALHFFGIGSLTVDAAHTVYLNSTSINRASRPILLGDGDYDFASGTRVRSDWFTNFTAAAAKTLDDAVTLEVDRYDALSGATTTGPYVGLVITPRCYINLNGFDLTVQGTFSADNTKAVDATAGGELHLAGGAADAINVTWFGAYPDGRNITPWLQYCITSAEDATNEIREIYFPDGDYSVGNTGVFVTAGIDALSFVGSTRRNTRFVKHVSWVDGSGVFNLPGTLVSPIQHVYFRDMTFYGGADPNTWEAIPIKASYAWNMMISNVQANTISPYFLDMECTDDIQIRDIKSYACGPVPPDAPLHGILYFTGDRSGSGRDLGRLTIDNAKIERSYGWAGYFDGVGGINITNSVFHGRVEGTDTNGTTSAGIKLQACNITNIDNTSFVHIKAGNAIYIEDANGVAPVTTSTSTSYTNLSNTFFTSIDNNPAIGLNIGNAISKLYINGTNFRYNATSGTDEYIHFYANVPAGGFEAGVIARVNTTTSADMWLDDRTDMEAWMATHYNYFGTVLKNYNDLSIPAANRWIGETSLHSVTLVGDPLNNIGEQLCTRIPGGHLLCWGQRMGPVTFNALGDTSDLANIGIPIEDDIIGAFIFDLPFDNANTKYIEGKIEQIDVFCAVAPGENYPTDYWRVSVGNNIINLDDADTNVRKEVIIAGNGGVLYSQHGYTQYYNMTDTLPVFFHEVNGGGAPTDPKNCSVSVWYSVQIR